MALVKCEDCGNDRSDQVGSACPKCGNVIDTHPEPELQKRRKQAGGFFGIVFGFGFIAFALFGGFFAHDGAHLIMAGMGALCVLVGIVQAVTGR